MDDLELNLSWLNYTTTPINGSTTISPQKNNQPQKRVQDTAIMTTSHTVYMIEIEMWYL